MLRIAYILAKKYLFFFCLLTNVLYLYLYLSFNSARFIYYYSF